ncbi:GAF domain-containing protein, partial [candidate division GN15 bacterium]|nr:GAF domain-containing protein [candidate division GN15 bacterium]
SWLATEISSDTPVFVKTPASDSKVSAEELQRVLVNSFNQQRGLTSQRVLTARKRRIEDGRLFVEYPYVDIEHWETLSPDTLGKRLTSLLPRLCIALDYIHLMDRVHGDVKVENFLVRCIDSEPRVLLSDLDLLRQNGGSVKSTVFGTPGFIAPEIKANEQVFIQSDNYSLGIALRQVAKKLGSTQSAGKVATLAERLIEVDYLRRPRVLIEALWLEKLIDDAEYDQRIRELFAMVWLSRFRSAARNRLHRPQSLDSFLRRDCRLFGVQDDFVHALAAAYASDRPAAYRIFRDFIGKSKVALRADYWHVSSDDTVLTDAYEALEDCLPASSSKPPRAFVTPKDAADALARTSALIDFGHRERAYLSLRRYCGDDCLTSGETTGDDKRVLEQKVVLAQSLRRLDEVIEYNRKLLDMATTPVEQLERLQRLIHVKIQEGDREQVDELLAQAMAIEDEPGTETSRRNIRRHQAWSLLAAGKKDAAIQTLEALIEESRQAGDYDTLVMSLYNRGVVSLIRGGDARSTESYLIEAYKTAEEHGIQHRCVIIGTTLAIHYNATARYELAARICRQAIKHATRPEHAPFVDRLYSAMSTSCVIMAEFDKAEYWLQRTLSTRQSSPFEVDVADAIGQIGYVRMRQGRLTESHEAYARVLEMHERVPVSHRSRCFTHLALSRLALYTGDIEAVHHHGREAKAAAKRYGGQSDIATAEWQTTLSDACYGEPPDTDHLTVMVRRLIEQSEYYAASWALLQLLLTDDQAALTSALMHAGTLRQRFRKSTVPLFRALDILFDNLEKKPLDAGASTSSGIDIASWKNALSVFMAGKNRFEATRVALRIGDHYRAVDKPMLARKFYQQAVRSARALKNQSFVAQAEARLAEVALPETTTSRLVSSMHEVSVLLKDLPNYQQALNSLIRFAVDQSGAERGVLLLRVDRSSKLYVAASVNCDDQSLTDITDFSTSVPDVALEELEPLVIENAITDSRTKTYKSVAMHNIMSVVCIPLLDGNKALGALYLDHHSLPALFGRDDIVFIRTIANFITVALRAAQRYRSLNLHNM